MNNPNNSSLRLQKYLSACGIASRREAEKLIVNGEIRVNNQIVTELGTKINPLVDQVKWRNKIVKPVQNKIYLLLNKPAGYICSLKEPVARKLVIDLIKPPLNKLVKPVGRLDFNTTGLLLLSNDGEFIQLMTHPSHKIIKKYRVKARGEINEEKLDKLRQGVRLEDGWSKAVEIRCERQKANNIFLVISIIEGRHHLVKRMCNAIGLQVSKLSRIAYGPLFLKGLKIGEYRHLQLAEVKMLKAAAR